MSDPVDQVTVVHCGLPSTAEFPTVVPGNVSRQSPTRERCHRGIRALQQRVRVAAVQRRRAPAHHGRGGDRADRRARRLQVHVGDRAPLPHRVLAPVGERGVPRLPRRGHVVDPHRFRHLQRHAARESPGPRRGTRRDARPPVRGSLRVRHGPRLVDDRAEGVRDHRSRSHPRDVRRSRRRVPQDVEGRGVPRLRRQVLLDAAPQRVAQAVLRAAPADVGRGRQSRPRSRRRRAWVSACCASRSAARSR